MKRVLVGFITLVFATAVYANCRTQTITTPDGRFVVCTVCCDQWGNCNTTCF